MPAVDFECSLCKAAYQLKSSLRWSETRVPDAAYDRMLSAVLSSNVPNLLVLQYNLDWAVENLMLVPSFFFSPEAVEKRPPLSLNARKAGWVGCNIRLDVVPPEGKLHLVRSGSAINPVEARRQYQHIKPLENVNVSERGWLFDVLRAVHKIGRPTFTIADVYEMEQLLADIYPGNRNVRAKMRQQLQVLRDKGLIEFIGRGTYRLVQRTGPS